MVAKDDVKKALLSHPELIKKQFRMKENPLFGFCYIASEVFYHLGGKDLGFRPYIIKIHNFTHWFLKNPNTGEIIDIIGDYNYSDCRSVPFLSKNPSKRSKIIIDYICDLESRIKEYSVKDFE